MGVNAEDRSVGVRKKYTPTQLAASRLEADLREATEEERAAFQAAQDLPDLADKANQDAGAAAIRKARAGSRRRTLLGSFGDVTEPLGAKTLLGGGS